MTLTRREFLAAAGSLTLVHLGGTRACAPSSRIHAMYGLIGKMTATPGNRDALAAVLLAGTERMPGCLSYVIANDPADEHALWITEVWDSQASHAASLQLPAVQAAIAKGRPMIAGFSDRVETTPIGGVGIAAPAR